MRFYVSIDGIEPEELEIFGYELVEENDNFLLFVHRPTGDDCLVDREYPYLAFDDVNDAQQVAARSGKKMITPSPMS